MDGVEWSGVWNMDRPEGELAMSAYLAAPEPVPTGYDKLDQLLGGGMMRGLTVLGGPPSSGKSVLACYAAAAMAARGQRVVYASYEMGWDVVQLRCASAWSCTAKAKELGAEAFSWAYVANGAERRSRPAYAGLSRGELSRYLVGAAADPITRTLTLWDEGPGRNLAVLTDGYDVHDLCETMSDIEGERPVLIVDYLQIMPTGTAQEQSEYQRVTEVVNTLQSYAYSERGGNVLALSSTRNLTSADYKDGPSLSWYRGSGYVGFAAEQAVMLVPERNKDDKTGQWVPSIAANGMQEGRMTIVKNKTGASGVSVPTLMAGWCNLMQ